jgi:hypothetical protein
MGDKQIVLRITPCSFGLYSPVVLIYLQLPDSLRLPAVLSWQEKSTVAFSAMMVCLRRAIWDPMVFANTRGAYAVLKTAEVITGNDPVCPGSRRIESKHCDDGEAADLLEVIPKPF